MLLLEIANKTHKKFPQVNKNRLINYAYVQFGFYHAKWLSRLSEGDVKVTDYSDFFREKKQFLTRDFEYFAKDELNA